MFKRLTIALTAFLMLFGSLVCVEAKTTFNKNDEWLIYMYICGADLEENAGASRDIIQIQNVSLPSNVKILIYANGAVNWKHNWIQKKGPGIYLYSSNGLQKLSSWKADMGKPETLKKFLKFGEENYKADHRMITFWDHGGLNGLCYDDAFDLNPNPEQGHHLTFYDLHKVFSDVYGKSSEKPFELIGFDLCLSGSYELANSIADFSRYMVGSEPTMYGWSYTGWLSVFANNPAMNGLQIGKAICDTTMMVRYDENTRLTNAFSVIDLSKMPELRKAYEKYFSKAKHLSGKKGFSGAFARAASARTTERYSNLYMDLGTLAENTKEIMPDESENLLDAIHSAVAYNLPGAYLQAHGISTYYPYISTNNPTVSKDEFDNFLTQKSTPKSQKSLYKKLLKLDASKLQLITTTQDYNGNIVAKLTPEQLENVGMARCLVLPYIEFGDESVGLEDEGFVVLPSDIDLKIDWQSGTFTDNFSGYWPTIDGHKICMGLATESPVRDFYEVPILLTYKRQTGVNEEEQPIYKIFSNVPVTLQVAYDFASKQFIIVGVGSNVENGMVRTLSLKLQPGDVITPLFLTLLTEESLDSEQGNVMRYTDPKTGASGLYKATYGESFTYTENTRFVHQPFKEGIYIYRFQFISPNGTATGSWPAFIKIDENGNIIKKVPTMEELTSIYEIEDLFEK